MFQKNVLLFLCFYSVFGPESGIRKQNTKPSSRLSKLVRRRKKMRLFPLPSSSLLGTGYMYFNSRLFGSVDFSVLKDFFLYLVNMCVYVCWGCWNYKTENDNEIARWWYTILTFFSLSLPFFFFSSHTYYLRLPFTHSNIFISSPLTLFCFLFLSLRVFPFWQHKISLNHVSF